MKRGGFVFLTLLLFLYLFTGMLFAQTKPEVAVAGPATVSQTTITPTKAQSTTSPTPTTAQTPSPTTPVTSTPTPQNVKPTNMPVTTQQEQPTATPTPVPPTPTSKPKLLILPIIPKKPPMQPVNSIITAPFNLVMNSLPHSYYSDAGLTPATNKMLLIAAFISLMSGTILLNWPALARTMRKLSIPAMRQRKSFPYATGRV